MITDLLKTGEKWPEIGPNRHFAIALGGKKVRIHSRFVSVESVACWVFVFAFHK
jgi:hypothetical protein